MLVLPNFKKTATPHIAASVAQTAISVSSVGKTFHRTDAPAFRALDDISFNVRTGRVTAILGASGCGKSTLLNMIAGLLATDQGEVCLEGLPVRDFTDWRHVGYLFQDDRLLPWRTSLENVEFGLEAEHVGRSERRSRAGQALSAVGLADFARSYPHELSGGMRSRVALARSLVKEPRILLLDEPFSKLDPSMRSQMHTELLQAQAARAITVIVVTHDIEEAVILADEVVVLQPNPGRVRDIVSIELPRPRYAVDQAVSEQVRLLRALV
jgi:ABC-type nitrate/sulfonate/bicarbonate transport system ATPase subunit